jgi:hypothetical protein
MTCTHIRSATAPMGKEKGSRIMQPVEVRFGQDGRPPIREKTLSMGRCGLIVDGGCDVLFDSGVVWDSISSSRGEKVSVEETKRVGREERAFDSHPLNDDPELSFSFYWNVAVSLDLIKGQVFC